MKRKTVIITGSTSGIGLGITQALAGQDADIIVDGFGDAAETRIGGRLQSGRFIK